MRSSDRIVTICADLNKFFHDYSILSESGLPDERDIRTYHALSMVLFTILNLCFEMGEEVISLLDTQVPQSYRDIFRILYKENIIDEDVMQVMSNLVYYRNRLAHQYAGLDGEDLTAIISNIDTIRIYIDLLKKKTQEIL